MRCLSLRAAGLPGICGAMLESHLHAGSQPFPRPLSELQHGVSITDTCIDRETTEQLVREAAVS